MGFLKDLYGLEEILKVRIQKYENKKVFKNVNVQKSKEKTALIYYKTYRKSLSCILIVQAGMEAILKKQFLLTGLLEHLLLHTFSGNEFEYNDVK